MGSGLRHGQAPAVVVVALVDVDSERPAVDDVLVAPVADGDICCTTICTYVLPDIPAVLLRLLVPLVVALVLELLVPRMPLNTSMKATESPLTVAETKLPARGASLLIAEVDIVLVGLLVVEDGSVDALEEALPGLLLVLEREPAVALVVAEEPVGMVKEPDQFIPVKVDW